MQEGFPVNKTSSKSLESLEQQLTPKICRCDVVAEQIVVACWWLSLEIRNERVSLLASLSSPSRLALWSRTLGYEWLRGQVGL